MTKPFPRVDASALPVSLAYRTAAAAKAIGICERKLRVMTKAGIVPHIKMGRAVLYPVAELQAWLSKKVGSP